MALLSDLVNSTFQINVSLERSLRFFEIIDDVNLKILETLYKVGPRNILEISRLTGIPKSTVYARIERLKNIQVTIEPLVTASKLGLHRLFIIIETHPGRTLPVYEIFNNMLWTYKLSISQEPHTRILARLYAPHDSLEFIKAFFKRLMKLRLIKSYEIYDVHEELYSSSINRKYVDVHNRTLTIPWNEWSHEIIYGKHYNEMRLPINILEKPKYHVEVDDIDVKIIEKIQANAFRDFVEIGRTLNLSASTIRHHYLKHIVRKGIITKYVPRIMLFHPSISKILVGIISFTSEKTMLNFVNVLWDSPIMQRFLRILNDNAIVVSLAIPRAEDDKFFMFLELLAKEGIIYDYKLYPIVMNSISSWTIPAELFVNGQWLPGWDMMLKAIKKVTMKITSETLRAKIKYY